MILCLNKSYLGGGKTKAVIGKEAVVIHTSWERDMFGHICGLGNVHVLSVLKHDYWVILFLFSFIVAIEQPHLMLLFWKIVYIQQEYKTTQLWVPIQLAATPKPHWWYQASFQMPEATVFSQGKYAKLQIWRWKNNNYCCPTQQPSLPSSSKVELQFCSGTHLAAMSLRGSKYHCPTPREDLSHLRIILFLLIKIGSKMDMWPNFGQWFLKEGLLEYHWKGFSPFIEDKVILRAWINDDKGVESTSRRALPLWGFQLYVIIHFSLCKNTFPIRIHIR